MVSPALARVLPFVLYLSFIAIADLLTRCGVAADALRWLYPVKIAVVAAALWLLRRHYVELAVPRLTARQALLAVGAGLLVLVLWLNLDAPWMVVGHSAGYDPREQGAINWLLVALRIAGAALVVPLMEELFWRSFLMRWIAQADFLRLSPANVKLRGFVVGVILFGIEHNLWLAGMVAGIAYSVLYMRSQNLWSPILAHAVTNGLLGAWVVFSGQWTYW